MRRRPALVVTAFPVVVLAACGDDAPRGRAATPRALPAPLQAGPPLPPSPPDPTTAPAAPPLADLVAALGLAHLDADVGTVLAALRDPGSSLLHAANHLADHGPAALPLVLALLGAGRADAAEFAVWAMVHIADSHLLTHDDRVALAEALRAWVTVDGVAWALRDLGRPGAEVLIRAPEGEHFDRALSQMGTEMVPALRDALRERAGVERVLRQVVRLGSCAADALPELVALLDDPRAAFAAARALAAAGDGSPATVRALVKGLDTEPRHALVSLARIGGGAASALPAVGGQLGSDDADVRAVAAAAWVRLGGDADRARQVVLSFVEVVEAAQRRGADHLDWDREQGEWCIATVVEALGADSAPLVGRIVAASEHVRTWCSHGEPLLVHAMRALGPAAAPGILEALLSPDPEVHDRAATLLDGIELPIPTATPRLLELAAAGNAHAASALGVSGRDANGVVEALTALVGTEACGSWAVGALGEFGPQARPAVEAIVAHGRAEAERGRDLGGVARALGRIGQATPGALDLLLAAIR